MQSTRTTFLLDLSYPLWGPSPPPLPLPPKKGEVHYSDQVCRPNRQNNEGHNTRNTEECAVTSHSLYTDRPTTLSEEALASIFRKKVLCLPSDIAC